MKDNKAIPLELDLWESFKKGDERAFVNIYQKYVNVLYRYGANITPDADLVKDCIQDLFLNLWNKRENLGETDSIKFYLLKSLKRVIHKALMAQNNILNIDDIGEGSSFNIVLPHESELISSQVMQEQRENLDRMMNKLTKRQREAIYLYFYLELSYEEVASMMSLKISSVYDLVYDAIKNMKQTVSL